MRCITCKKSQKVRKKRHCWEASNQCAPCHYLGKKSTGRGYTVSVGTDITVEDVA